MDRRVLSVAWGWELLRVACSALAFAALAPPVSAQIGDDWRINGNGWVGDLTLQADAGGGLNGRIYGELLQGYHAAGERTLVLLRGGAQPTQAYVGLVSQDGATISGRFYGLNATSSGASVQRNVFAFSALRGRAGAPANPAEPAEPAGPGSVARSYGIDGNGHLGTLQLTQASDGTLAGTVYGHTVAGHYAAGTGTIAFVRYEAPGRPYQLYVGRADAQGLRGSFYALTPGAGAGTARMTYNWVATTGQPTVDAASQQTHFPWPAAGAVIRAQVETGGAAQLPGTGPQQVRAYLDGLPRLAVVPSLKRPVAVELPAHLREAGYSARANAVRAVNSAPTLFFQRPLAATFWPGALVQGGSITGTQFAAIDLPRAPGRVRLVGGFVAPAAAAIHRDVPVADAASVESARQQLAQQLAATDAAGVSEAKLVHARTLEDAMVKLNVAYDGGPASNGNFSGTLNLRTDETLIVGRYTHIFYGAAFDPDPQTQSLLAPSVTLQQVQRFAGPTNPPLYISQVLYGRMAFVTFRSQASLLDLEAALKAAHKQVKGGLDLKYRETLDRTSIEVIQVGQTGANSINPVTIQDGETLREALARFIDQGQQYSPGQNPGLPIGVVLNYVGSGAVGQVAVAPLVAEYVDIAAIDPPPQQCQPDHYTWDGPQGGWRRVQQADGRWLRVNAGDTVQFVADGTNWSGVFATGAYGPQGWHTWPQPRADHMAPITNRSPFGLIGRFGDAEARGADPAWAGGQCSWEAPAGCSSAFWIGSARTVQAGSAPNVAHGEVWLGTNDDNTLNGDRAHQFRVSVCVTRKPYVPTSTENRSFSF